MAHGPWTEARIPVGTEVTEYRMGDHYYLVGPLGLFVEDDGEIAISFSSKFQAVAYITHKGWAYVTPDVYRLHAEQSKEHRT